MQEEKRRSSAGCNKNRAKMMEQVLEKFVSRQFLTTNSLFHNLYSSEELAVDLADSALLRTVFNSKAVGERELHELCYFHKREKKLVLYAFLLHFLTQTAKFELVLMLNGEQLDEGELRDFLGTAWEPFTKRVLVMHHSRAGEFAFNLGWLAQLRKEREFLKGVVICDVNSFEAGDKGSTEKYYRRLPRELLVVAFRRDLYEYKVFHRSSLAYISDQQDLREINEKLAHYLHKKLEFFSFRCCLLAPLEYVYPSKCKTIEDTFKTVMLRSGGQQGERIEEIVFEALPFRVESEKEF
jgi:hypothetical protein